MLSQERREELSRAAARIMELSYSDDLENEEVIAEAADCGLVLARAIPQLLSDPTAVERERDKAVADFNDCFKAARAWAELVNCIEAISELDKFDEMTSDQQKLDAYIQSWSKMKERAELAERERDALREQCLLLARLAKCQDGPQFFNPLEAMAAVKLRDDVLREQLKGEGA